MMPRFLGETLWNAEPLLLIAALMALLLALTVAAIALKWGPYWLQAYMSGAEVSFVSLVAMSFLRIPPRMIVTAMVMGRQAALPMGSEGDMSTARLQAHHLAGGSVTDVVRALIAAARAGIDLDFDRAAAIDLAGRNVLDAVQTSISPKVISCPNSSGTRSEMLSAVSRNGVELRVGARVTVRTNLDQLIGGATEETLIARVGQGIISAIGSAPSHMDVLEMPSRISKGAMANGLDSNTAFSIVSIDIADIDVGENIGARLQIDQADADTRIARAQAEVRRAAAIAEQQQMKAKIAENRAALVLAEAEVPAALAEALRAGRLRRISSSSVPAARCRNPQPSQGDRHRRAGGPRTPGARDD